MTAAILAGLVCGLATIGISEALIAYWARRPLEAVWRVSACGVALRTLWVFAALAIVSSKGWFSPEPFVVSLLGGYLIAQVVEGFRYKRSVEAR